MRFGAQVMAGIADSASDGVADFLRCLSVLEEKTSLLFEDIAGKMESISFNSKLREISNDNRRHAKILMEMSQHVGNPKVEIKECRRKLSSVFRKIEQVHNEVSQKEKITAQQLQRFISILDSSESEEQFMLIQAKTFQFMSKEIDRLYGVNFEKYRNLLVSIAKDEENHRQILDEIGEILGKN